MTRAQLVARAEEFTPGMKRGSREVCVLTVAELAAEFERIQRDAMAEARDEVRRMLIAFSNEPPPEGHDRRRYVCNEVLVALDALKP